MKKILLLLPFLTLSACFSTDGSNQSVVEDKSSHADKVEPIVREESNFNWRDSTTASNNSFKPVAASPEAKAIAKFKASKASFILYFAYDEFDIDAAATQEIIKHANFMRDNPKLKLRLEGHADERGTREYNLALGENRAISIKELLGLYQGLDNRVQVVSYGEEKPVVEGHDEGVWGKNRRVEFVYQVNSQ